MKSKSVPNEAGVPSHLPEPTSSIMERLSTAVEITPSEREAVTVLLENKDPSDLILRDPSIRRPACLALFAALAPDESLTEGQLSIVRMWHKKESARISAIVSGMPKFFNTALEVLLSQGKFQLLLSILDRLGNLQVCQDALEIINEENMQADPGITPVASKALLKISEHVHSRIKSTAQGLGKDVEDDPSQWARASLIIESSHLDTYVDQIKRAVFANESLLFDNERIYSTLAQVSQYVKQIRQAGNWNGSENLYGYCDWIQSLLHRQALSEIGGQGPSDPNSAPPTM